MPSRGSYQITNAAEGKAAQRDQSYRSCVITLLIFLFLCIILIVTLPWKTYYNTHQEDEYMETARHHHEHQTERTTSPTTSIKYYLNTTTTADEKNSNTQVTTENSNVVNITNWANNDSHQFEKFLNTETITEDLSVFSVTVDETTTNYSIYNTNSYAKNDTLILTTEEYKETTATDRETSESATELNYIVSETFSDNYENTTDKIIESTKKNEENTTIKSITESLQEIDTLFTTLSTEEDVTNEHVSTTSDSLIDKQVCLTGECKNLASKMLFFMNHTVDPCEDFYEYACGGFETNPQTIERNLEDEAYRRILRQMEKENASSLFAKYYNSCMKYEDIDRIERIKMAREVLDKVGQFYTTDEWAKNHTNFTELVAKLLLHNSALLFDIAPDLDEYSPQQFTLKIGPTTYNNPFETDVTSDPCFANQFEKENETVDLGELYMKYKKCKSNTGEFIKSIKEALTVLGVFNKLNNTYNVSQYLYTTSINIDIEIMQNFFSNFPSKDKIREEYLMKNYTRVKIEDLEAKFKIINWTRLIYLLTKELVKPEIKVQVYFYDTLAKGLESLNELGKREPMILHNALLALYARDLYHEFVLSKHQDAKKHCLRVATNVLIPEASKLYISSFSKDQLTYMSKTIHSLFEKLKETLKLKIKEVEWVTGEERIALIEKIDNLKVVVPDISYFTDRNSTYGKIQANEVNLSNNYFENSVNLMQRYRKLIYAELFTNPGYPEQIWTHYATPHQSKGLAIYGLNLVVIPFGAIDWSIKYNELPFDYIIMATLGNVIAHQIAHHFDANGIYYWNGTRDAKNSLLNNNDSTNMNFKEYIENERDLYQNPNRNMTLLFTGQTIFYEISKLSLNERLSETMGLRLAYDTLDRLRSPEEVNLPWLELDFNQLYYLTYAQIHCTKSPLTSSYIPLYENEQLPSRIRIFLSASNSRLLGKAWNCPEGSRIMPSYVCTGFPYLQCNNDA